MIINISIWQLKFRQTISNNITKTRYITCTDIINFKEKNISSDSKYIIISSLYKNPMG